MHTRRFQIAIVAAMLPLALGIGCSAEKTAEVDIQKAKPLFIDWCVFGSQGEAIFPSRFFPDTIGSLPLIPMGNDQVRGVKDDLLEKLSVPGWDSSFQVMHGIPCLSVNSGRYKSNLDVLVSIHLGNVSAFEAIVAIAREVNCGLFFGERLQLQSMAQPGPFPPEEFDAVKSVTVDVDNVTAREALCLVMRQSPVEIGLQCWVMTGSDWERKGQLPISQLDIFFFENGKTMHIPRPTGNDQRIRGISRNWREGFERAKTPDSDCRKSGGQDGFRVDTVLHSP